MGQHHLGRLDEPRPHLRTDLASTTFTSYWVAGAVIAVGIAFILRGRGRGRGGGGGKSGAGAAQGELFTEGYESGKS